MPLPIASPHNIALIDRHMSTLLELEPLPIGVACKKFVRTKVEFDVSFPLKMGFFPPIPLRIRQKSHSGMEDLVIQLAFVVI